MEWLAANAGLIFFFTFFALMIRMHARGSGHRAAPGPEHGQRAAPPRGGGKESADGILVRVQGAFNPARIEVPAGAPARLVFRREEADSCSERVVFPDYQWVADLGAFKDTVVELPARGPGEHEFTCAEGRLRGTLVVASPDERARAVASRATPPLLVGAMSLLIPGLGHFLIRSWVRGGIWLAGWLVVSAASGIPHGPAVLVLMVIAAVDGYVIARSKQQSPPGHGR